MGGLLSRHQSCDGKYCEPVLETLYLMPAQFDSHLEALRARLRTGSAAREDVLRELSDHLEDRTVELEAQHGLSHEEARIEAARVFGDAQEIASDLSFVHNQGSWREVFFSALPHLLTALLFASHRWLEPELLIAAFTLALGVSGVGWRHGKPIWMYPWLGYALFPFLLAGTISVATLGNAIWSIVTQGYTPTNPLSWGLGIGLGVLGIALISYLLIWTGRRDWVHAALFVLPIPFLAVSLLAFDRGTYTGLEETATQTAILFVFVAFAVGIVVRVGDRLLKIGLIAASLPIGFLLSSSAMEPDIRIALVILLSLAAALLVAAPFLMSWGPIASPLKRNRGEMRRKP